MMIRRSISLGLSQLLKIRPNNKFSSDKPESTYGVKIDEDSIKRKMKEIKERQDNLKKAEREKSSEILKNYQINKAKPETKKFREMTETENIFQIQDLTLDEKPTTLQINSYSNQSIQIDEFLYPPSLILTPNQIFLWEVNKIEDLKVSHFKLIEVINPPPIYIILGVHDPFKVPQQVRNYLAKLGVNCDILPEFEAVSNYNVYSTDELNLMAFFNFTQ